MSILLEALRKSENSQQKGEIPTIHGYDPAVADEPQRRAPRWWWVAAVLIALIAAYFAWNQFSTNNQGGWDLVENPTSSETTAPDRSERSAPPDEAPLVEPPGETAAGRRSAREPQTASDPARVVQEPVQEQSSATRPSSPVESLPPSTAASGSKNSGVKSQQTREERAAQLATEYQSLRSTSGDESNSDTTSNSPPVANSKPEPVSPVNQRETQQASDRPRRRPPSSQQAARQQQSSGPEPISFWELPESVRSSLPELKINVLVFAGHPADRFILMGGKRLAEGENVIEGLDLEEIRRDGAVFSYEKYQFLVKH